MKVSHYTDDEALRTMLATTRYDGVGVLEPDPEGDEDSELPRRVKLKENWAAFDALRSEGRGGRRAKKAKLDTLAHGDEVLHVPTGRVGTVHRGVDSSDGTVFVKFGRLTQKVKHADVKLTSGIRDSGRDPLPDTPESEPRSRAHEEPEPLSRRTYGVETRGGKKIDIAKASIKDVRGAIVRYRVGSGDKWDYGVVLTRAGKSVRVVPLRRGAQKQVGWISTDAVEEAKVLPAGKKRDEMWRKAMRNVVSVKVRRRPRERDELVARRQAEADKAMEDAKKALRKAKRKVKDPDEQKAREKAAKEAVKRANAAKRAARPKKGPKRTVKLGTDLRQEVMDARDGKPSKAKPPADLKPRKPAKKVEIVTGQTAPEPLRLRGLEPGARISWDSENVAGLGDPLTGRVFSPFTRRGIVISHPDEDRIHIYDTDSHQHVIVHHTRIKTAHNTSMDPQDRAGLLKTAWQDARTQAERSDLSKQPKELDGKPLSREAKDKLAAKAEQDRSMRRAASDAFTAARDDTADIPNMTDPTPGTSEAGPRADAGRGPRFLAHQAHPRFLKVGDEFAYRDLETGESRVATVTGHENGRVKGVTLKRRRVEEVSVAHEDIHHVHHLLRYQRVTQFKVKDRLPGIAPARRKELVAAADSDKGEHKRLVDDLDLDAFFRTPTFRQGSGEAYPSAPGDTFTPWPKLQPVATPKGKPLEIPFAKLPDNEKAYLTGGVVPYTLTTSPTGNMPTTEPMRKVSKDEAYHGQRATEAKIKRKTQRKVKLKEASTGHVRTSKLGRAVAVAPYVRKGRGGKRSRKKALEAPMDVLPLTQAEHERQTDALTKLIRHARNNDGDAEAIHRRLRGLRRLKAMHALIRTSMRENWADFDARRLHHPRHHGDKITVSAVTKAEKVEAERRKEHVADMEKSVKRLGDERDAFDKALRFVPGTTPEGGAKHEAYLARAREILDSPDAGRRLEDELTTGEVKPFHPYADEIRKTPIAQLRKTMSDEELEGAANAAASEGRHEVALHLDRARLGKKAVDDLLGNAGKILGDNLLIDDPFSMVQQERIQELNRLTTSELQLLKKNNVQIHLEQVGAKELFARYPHLRLDLSPGTLGFFIPSKSSVYILHNDNIDVGSPRDPGAFASVTLHEVGHALDYLGSFGGDPSKNSFAAVSEAVEHHGRIRSGKRTLTTDEATEFGLVSRWTAEQMGKDATVDVPPMRKYFAARTDKWGRPHGALELVAEGFSWMTLLGWQATATHFDDEFANWLENRLNDRFHDVEIEEALLHYLKENYVR